MKRSVAKEFERHALELDGDLRVALRHTLACSEIEWHPRPAPIVDVEFQSHERLGARFRSDSGFRPICGYVFSCRLPRAILATDTALQNVVRGQGLNRVQNFSLLIAHCVRLKR